MMKKNRLLIWAWVMLFGLAANALAGDYAHFHFIGFSRDGKYLAFEEYGINDAVEDSSPYATLYIVDVEKNRWATNPFKTSGHQSPEVTNAPYDAGKLEDEVRAKARRRAARQLKEFGIIDGNTGLQVAAHLINEYKIGEQTVLLPQNDAEASASNTNSNTSQNAATNSSAANANSNSPVNQNTSFNQKTAANSSAKADSQAEKEAERDPLSDYVAYLPQAVAFTKRGNTLYRDGYYELKINPVPVKQKNCDEYEREMFSFELMLKNEQNETRLLQKAGEVPKNRGCVNGYGIQEAFLYRNKLAVFVGIFTRGWEGENLRLMAVTGNLDD